METKTVEAQTQSQLLWDMAFSKKLEAVVCCERSLAFWELEQSKYRCSKAKNAKDKQADAKRICADMRRKIYEFRTELETWVKNHPYPNP